jgi:hypothetical protein
MTHEGAVTSGLEELPGWELVGTGLADVAAGRETVAAGLGSSASMRLAARGLTVQSDTTAQAADRVFALVVAEVGDRRAHARYNALRRRLAGFLRAAPRARTG